MTFGVVEGLQSDDVDVGDDELAAGPAAAVQLVVQVGQARRARACSRQRVGLGDCELVREQLAVNEGMQPLTGGVFAVLCRALAVVVGQRALLGGFCTAPSGALAWSAGVDGQLGAGDRALAVALPVGGTALCNRVIARVGGLVACQRREITGVRARVTLVGGVQAGLGVWLRRRTAPWLRSALNSCARGSTPCAWFRSSAAGVFSSLAIDCSSL